MRAGEAMDIMERTHARPVGDRLLATMGSVGGTTATDYYVQFFTREKSPRMGRNGQPVWVDEEVGPRLYTVDEADAFINAQTGRTTP